jgi:hypothetical protein
MVAPFKLCALLAVLVAPVVLGRPTNDECGGALPIPDTTNCGDTISGSTIDADFDPVGDNFCGTKNTGRGVWYTVMGTGGDMAMVVTETIATAFDTKLFVYTGNCDTLTCVEGDDDGGQGLLSQVKFTSTLDTEYFILVSGFETETGNFELSVDSATCPARPPPPTPVNDKCTAAVDITCGSNIVASTVSATFESVGGNFCGTDNTSPGVWYKFTGTGDLVLTETTSANFDTKLFVYEGTKCASLECVDGDDQDGSGDLSEVLFFSTPGTEYFILVGGFESQVGNFELNVSCRPPPTNSECNDAAPIPCGSTILGTTLSVVFENVGDNNCGTSITAPGVWYKLIGTGGDMVVTDMVLTETIAASFDTKLFVFEGTCDTLECVDGDDDGGGVGGLSQVTFSTTAGTAYFILVSGFDSFTGDFELSADSMGCPELQAKFHEGSSGGDPHFKTWNHDKYDFHGACDLVLLSNPEFDNNMGMEIHIRTKIRFSWSYIETAILKIGNDTLEIMGGDMRRYWINGVFGSSGKEFPIKIGGYTVDYEKKAVGPSKQRIYTVDLGRSDKIVMKTYKDFVSVDIKAVSDELFVDSVGLMGSYTTGDKLARDGETVLSDPIAFGQEWQVLMEEPKLFHSLEGPQQPLQQCEMPAARRLKNKGKKRLGQPEVLAEQPTGVVITHAAAEAACAYAQVEDRDVCIFDVLATNDVEMAGAY